MYQGTYFPGWPCQNQFVLSTLRIMIHSKKPGIWYRSTLIFKMIKMYLSTMWDTNINIPAHAHHLCKLWPEKPMRRLRTNNKWKLERVCDCGESIDAVEAEDEGRIIICRWKGCETLWVSVFEVVSFSLLTTHWICSTTFHVLEWIVVSMTGFVTCARVWREAGEGAANKGVQCRCKTAADTTPKTCSIYSIYLYMEVYSHA